MTAIVNLRFLPLAIQVPIADDALGSAVPEKRTRISVSKPAPITQHSLNVSEDFWTDQGLMQAGERFTGPTADNIADVEAVAKETRESVSREQPTMTVAKITYRHFRPKSCERKSSGSVERKELLYEWSSCRIPSLGAATTLIKIPKWRFAGPETLSKPVCKTLPVP
jgi:hypothetical protein